MGANRVDTRLSPAAGAHELSTFGTERHGPVVKPELSGRAKSQDPAARLPPARPLQRLFCLLCPLSCCLKVTGGGSWAMCSRNPDESTHVVHPSLNQSRRLGSDASPSPSCRPLSPSIWEDTWAAPGRDISQGLCLRERRMAGSQVFKTSKPASLILNSYVCLCVYRYLFLHN